jgi:DNA polymerase (family 10)
MVGAPRKIRRPRAQLQPVVEQLGTELSLLNPGLEFTFCGSWRRGVDVIGDLDILVITETGRLAPDLLDPGVELPESVTWQHLDVWCAKPESRGAMLVFTTGPGQLNMRQRARAKARGMALSQNGLTDRESGVQLDDGTEQDIYRLLGLPYLSPEERQRYAGH